MLANLYRMHGQAVLTHPMWPPSGLPALGRRHPAVSPCSLFAPRNPKRSPS